jgi:hypothetical protein
VPIYYGDVSRQAAMILRNNSENSLNAVPAMACYISALTYDRDRVLNPYFEGKMNIREQTYNESTQSYNGAQDGIYTIERLMPAPYKLQMKVDMWTSNTEQKHQLIEQIAPIFNPALEIQNSTNYADWSSLSAVFLTDTIYTSRSVPMMGDDSTIDIATLTFEMPIWINLPAKVKKMGVVAQIIASIFNDTGSLSNDAVTALQGLVSQQRFTPLNYELVFMGNSLTLYNTGAGEMQLASGTAQWAGLVNLYGGTLQNGISQVRLQFEHSDGFHEIVGTVAYDPTNTSNLIYQPISSTLPANTLTPVNAIIDPYNVNVNNVNILTPTVGTRYLILNPIGSVGSDSPAAWAGTQGTDLVANANDIIQWTGSFWTVAFNSQQNPGIQYLTNLNTNVQYCWNGGNWIKSYEGLYRSGSWSLVI